MQDNRELVIELYDIYKNLLTDKQRNYFEEYYLYDCSLAEIAENHNVSRNACFDALKKTEDLLNEYESKLGLYNKFNKLSETLNLNDLNKIKDIIKNIVEE